MQKKKVLYLLSSNKYSGAENVVSIIINNVKDEYECAYCSPDGPISESMAEREIEFLPLKKFSYSELKKVVNTYKPDIIHAHDYKASCLAALFHKKCKIISHIHGNNAKMRNKNIKSMIYILLSKYFSSIIWVSDSCFDDYAYSYKLKSKSTILYNVIDSKEVEKKAEAYNCKEEYDLIFLGRIAEQKNPQRLIKVIEMIRSIKKDIKVAIVGDGDLRPEVERLIKENKLEKNIKMFGFISNPYPILKMSKILIMTSRWEGTPMVALEAQSLGKPIISTPVDGLKKIIKNDYNGFLNDDDKKLRDRIIDLLLDNKKLKEISKNTIEQFLKYNDLKKYKKTIKEIYNNI